MNCYWPLIHPYSQNPQSHYLFRINTNAFYCFNYYDAYVQKTKPQIIDVQVLQVTQSTIQPRKDAITHTNKVPSFQQFEKNGINISQTSNSNIFKYPKKNAESNIINQAFSFLSSPSKSGKILLKLLNQDSAKVELYYTIFKQLKKKKRKYINRDYVRKLLQMDSSHLIRSILRKNDLKNIFTSQELQRTIGILVGDYFRNNSIPTVLTSLKLDRITKKEHIWRCREVYSYLKSHLKVISQVK